MQDCSRKNHMQSKRKVFIILGFLFCLLVFKYIDSRYYNYYAVQKRFKGTEAYLLSYAVKYQCVPLIKLICKKNPQIMYTMDTKNQITLLHWAVGFRKYRSARALLDCGMNPDTPGEFNETPLYTAAGFSYTGFCDNDTKMIDLLLEYHADPSISIIIDEEVARTIALYFPGKTPLMNTLGFGNNVPKIKLLVEKGHADINQKSKSGSTVATEALGMKNIDAAYYLIVEKKAVVNEIYYSEKIIPNEETMAINPVDLLRYWVYRLDSEEYKKKMEIVEEFKRQGVDYFETGIPKFTLEQIKKLYPDTWEEYIKVY